jgi:ornithine cyclodeaminase/alanine dehydrogenase-like protein (mu-crystallin family)
MPRRARSGARGGRGGYRELRDACRKPIIKGAWLKPGTHLDLIGSFTPFMREADDEVFQRGHVWLDTYDALRKAANCSIRSATA